MELLREVFKWFLYITTGILIVTTIMFSMGGEDTMPVNTLWKILLAGLLTTGVTVCFKPWKNWGFVGYICHYMALCVVMILCGCLFGWMKFNLVGVLGMMLDVAVVYMIAFLTYWLVDLKQADEINKKLQERYKDEE